ncbi:MAG: isoprenyl transferase [Proteobacteria bacterium]|nr:isoprenyl transferase [Pseudomonadota bacterium]
MKERLPKHIAIIMDGNGRWAKLRNRPRVFGHRKGISVVKNVVEYCSKRGIQYLTLFAFSSENWQRPLSEVKALMGFLKKYLVSEINWLIELGIRFNVIGNIDKLPPDVKEITIDAMKKTATMDRMVLNLALSYGGKDEIIRAVRRVCKEVENKTTKIEEIDEKFFSNFLDTSGQPDPDLLIRTSGEYRISNFLLWQIAYTELYFTNTLWPDFTVEELEFAIRDYMKRERRFGKV